MEGLRRPWHSRPFVALSGATTIPQRGLDYQLTGKAGWMRSSASSTEEQALRYALEEVPVGSEGDDTSLMQFQIQPLTKSDLGRLPFTECRDFRQGSAAEYSSSLEQWLEQQILRLGHPLAEVSMNLSREKKKQCPSVLHRASGKIGSVLGGQPPPPDRGEALRRTRL